MKLNRFFKCANIMRASGRSVVLAMLFSQDEKDTRGCK